MKHCVIFDDTVFARDVPDVFDSFNVDGSRRAIVLLLDAGFVFPPNCRFSLRADEWMPSRRHRTMSE